MEYTDTDGTPLLFVDAIEELTGWTNETIRHYATAGNRARNEGTVPGDYVRVLDHLDAARARLAALDPSGDGTSKRVVTARKRVRDLEHQARLMPKPARKVRRTMTKADGKPLVVWSPLYREDHVMAWLRARGVLNDADQS